MEWKALVTSLLFSGSSFSPQTYDENICEIVTSHWGWAESLESASKKHKISKGLILSIIFHESSFRSDVRPPPKKYLGFISWQTSSAYGYAQVKDETWKWYRSHNPGWFQSRTQFGDSCDFIGWYFGLFVKKNPTMKSEYADFYLSYHEGLGGYKSGSYKGNKWLINKAHSVSERAKKYDIQLQSCF